MGDDSPDEIELVCTSCETEFIHEGVPGRLPSVPCPDCGEPVSLQWSDSEEEGGDESPPDAQVVEGVSDGPVPPEGAGGAGHTLMGMGPQAVSTDETGDEDTSATGDAGGDDGGAPSLDKIIGEEPESDMGDDEDDVADGLPSGESTDEESGAEGAGGDAGVDRSFTGGEDDDVHNRETSVSREPLSEMSPDEDGGDNEASNNGAVGDQSSDGDRLSDLKDRLQEARHTEDEEEDGGEENLFEGEDGGVGSEETRVASDSGIGDGFAEKTEADEAMEVTVQGEESTGDAEGDEEIPEPDVEFGGGDEPQESDEEHLETKPAGEDTILEMMQSGGGGDEPDESVETAEQSPPEEAVETAERTDPEEADTAEQPVASADEKLAPEETPAVDDGSDSGGGEQNAEVSDSGGEPSQDTGLGGSSSVPRPEDVREDEDVGDEETPSTDTEAERGPESAAASHEGDEQTREAEEGAEEDLDLEEMSREMADEASDIINEMRDEGELEPEAPVEDEDGRETAGSGAPPIPDDEQAGEADGSGAPLIPNEEEAGEAGGSGAPPVPEDVGTNSDGEAFEKETGPTPPPKPEPASCPPPGSDSSAGDNPGDDQQSGAGSPDRADRAGEELPKPVAEADVEFPDTSPADDSVDSPGLTDDGSPESSPPSPAADQREPPTPAATGRSEPSSAPDPAAAESGGGGSTTLFIGAGLAGVVLVGAGLFFLLDPMGLQQGGNEESPEAAAAKKQKQEKAGQNEKVGEALQAARSTFGEATAVDVSDADLQREVADRLAEQGDARSASRIYDVLWDRSAENTELANRYIDLLVDGGRFQRARRVAVQALGFADEGAGFEEKFDKALQSDDVLGSWDPVELDDSSKIASLGASSDVDYSGLILRNDAGKPVGLWRPATDEDGPWRDSIAAWRLCQVLPCQFAIPRTRPSRISRSTFEAKFDGESGNLIPGEFDWVTREGPDGGEVEYLYGALRDWPGEVTRWPIEEYDVWRPWLTAGGETEVMEKPVSEAVVDFQDLGDGSLHEGVLAESEGLDVRPVARQLSCIITFDFLTNNWGRFEDDEADYGASNHFADGGFVTMETDTVFQRRKSTRVKGRFRWISRFSGDMVRSIRLLDRQSTREMLYPDASSIERAKFDIFWEQRETLLSRVDELTDEHGRDDVLLFR